MPAYMHPFPEELLQDPVELRCGVVMRECQGAAMDVAELNRPFYGICENHPGSWDEQNLIEEGLAEDFTPWLGHGRGGGSRCGAEIC